MANKRPDTIVLVEDIPEQREAMKLTLEQIGYEVRAYESGTPAIHDAEQKLTSWFILDVHMGPGRENEGLRAMQSIKASLPSSVVVVLSNYPEKIDLASDFGADLAIPKSGNIPLDALKCAHALALTEIERLSAKPEQTRGIYYLNRVLALLCGLAILMLLYIGFSKGWEHAAVGLWANIFTLSFGWFAHSSINTVWLNRERQSL